MGKEASRNRTRIIYILRARCEPCKLDKMVSFYRVPNATVSAMYKGHEEALLMKWEDKYNCPHSVYFERETETNYKWDIKEQKAVPR